MVEIFVSHRTTFEIFSALRRDLWYLCSFLDIPPLLLCQIGLMRTVNIKFTMYAVIPKSWASMSQQCYFLLSSREKEAKAHKRARQLARDTRATAPAKVRSYLESNCHIYFGDYV